MDMEWVRRRSSIAAAAALLIFLTLAVLTATASASAGDDAAAAAAEQSQHCHPHPNPPLAADEPYALLVFQNTKDGEEIRLLADQRPFSRGGYSYANRSGNWFYAIRERDDEDGSKRRRRRLLLPQRSNAAQGLWHTLGTLVNATAAGDDPAAADGGGDGGERYYMVVGMQTGGGDKVRLVVVADQRQGYMFITGFAKGFVFRPRWFFREGELLPLPSLGGGGSSHAEAVASSLLAALKKAGSSCCG